MSALRPAALLLAAASGCWLGASAPQPAPTTVIPFDPYGGAIYVPGAVNGDTAWLMFDTGLSRSGIDLEWAHATRVAPAESVNTAVLDTLRLGELQLHHYRAMLYEMSGLSEASGRLQRGLLGHDVLQHFTVEIDYPARRIRLLDPSWYRYGGAGAIVPFTADADLPLLSAKVKAPGRHAIPARLLLDTGASGLCLILTAPFVEQYELDRVRPAIDAPIGTGLAGELHGTIVRLQELQLGRVHVRSPTTGLGGESKGFLGRTDIDGVIGNAVFEGSRLILDYSRHRIIIEPGTNIGSAPCDYDMSGMRLAARGPGLRHVMVDYVVPRSPSADAGIRAGDELLLIDGRGAGDDDLSNVRRILRVDGAVRRLLLRRADDTLRVSLKLRRLL